MSSSTDMARPIATSARWAPVVSATPVHRSTSPVAALARTETATDAPAPTASSARIATSTSLRTTIDRAYRGWSNTTRSATRVASTAEVPV